LRIAVTGAGGRVGGKVVELLAAEEKHQVVALSRRDAHQGPPRPNVTPAAADYSDLAALRAAMREVDTLVFVTSDGETAKVLIHHHNVIQAAVASGVSHIVALSSLDADLESPFCYAVTNRRTEQLISDSGCSVSVSRASIFTEFFLRWLTEAATTGELRLPAADGRISLVSRDDVARSLAALAVAPPTGRHHDVTGPESLDLATLASLTQHRWQTPVRYVDVTPADHCQEMARAGVEPWWLYAFSSMFASVREQRWASVSDEVRRLTGQQPAAVRDLLTQHRPA
jgi:NAD(P)H dehydrogenase (quinone)